MLFGQWVRGPSTFFWIIAICLFTASWFLPILKSEGSNYIGYDGAEFAHLGLWDILTNPKEDRNLSGVLFVLLGWPANELFVLGALTVRRWPRQAVRAFALSLGIMLSWQILAHNNFPLLIGYWFWVFAGAITLSLSAIRQSSQVDCSLGRALLEPVAVTLFLIPVVNVTLGVALN